MKNVKLKFFVWKEESKTKTLISEYHELENTINMLLKTQDDIDEKIMELMKKQDAIAAKLENLGVKESTYNSYVRD